MISQSKSIVQQYIRQPDGDWKIKVTIGLGSKVYFESVDAELELEEIYQSVDFSLEENL